MQYDNEKIDNIEDRKEQIKNFQAKAKKRREFENLLVLRIDNCRTCLLTNFCKKFV